jgi:antifreeze-like protein
MRRSASKTGRSWGDLAGVAIAAGACRSGIMRLETIIGRQNIVSGRQNISSHRQNMTSGRQNMASCRQNIVSWRQNIISGRQNTASCRPNIASGRPNLVSSRPIIVSGRAMTNSGRAGRRGCCPEQTRFVTVSVAVVAQSSNHAAGPMNPSKSPHDLRASALIPSSNSLCLCASVVNPSEGPGRRDRRPMNPTEVTARHADGRKVCVRPTTVCRA